MGFSRFAVPQTTMVRTGEERATLVRRTYTLVLASVGVTIAGAAYAMTQPRMMEAVIAHPWIMLACVFAPMLLAQVARNSFPQNIGFVFLFTFAEGLYIAPFIAIAEQHSPGIAAQAGLLTFSAFAALTTYSFFSRRDFSAWGGFLFTGVFVLLLTIVLNSVPSESGGRHLPGMRRNRRSDFQRIARVRHMAHSQCVRTR